MLHTDCTLKALTLLLQDWEVGSAHLGRGETGISQTHCCLNSDIGILSQRLHTVLNSDPLSAFYRMLKLWMQG